MVDDVRDGAGPQVQLDGILGIVSNPEDLMSFVYPHGTLHDLLMCLKWSILCPTNAQVNFYNDTLLECVEGIPCIYHAADSLKDIKETRLTPPECVLDYVAQHSSPGFPALAQRCQQCLNSKCGRHSLTKNNFCSQPPLRTHIDLQMISFGTCLCNDVQQLSRTHTQ